MPFPVQNIRDAAKAKGLTLRNIEQALSIGNGVVAKWEKNKSAPPYDRIVAIANYLEVPVSQLTGENEQKEKPAQESGPNKDALYKVLPELDRSELIDLISKASELLRDK